MIFELLDYRDFPPALTDLYSEEFQDGRSVTIEIKILHRGEEGILANVASEVFDNTVDLARTTAFLQDARHHLAVALDAGQVVGFASAMDYIHPDKPVELWINEIGVAFDASPTGHWQAAARSLI